MLEKPGPVAGLFLLYQLALPMAETDLYPPVKAYLEGQGYEVKGEIQGCDVLAVRGGEAPVIVELKASFTLALVLQGVRRLAISDHVYVAAPPFTGKSARQHARDVTALCRRIGLGLMTVRTDPSPAIEILCDPIPYKPRKDIRKRGRLLREFERRVGDPTAGGSSTHAPRMTAYRQDALRCARYLAEHGPTKASIVASAATVPKARAMMYQDVYGWFERADKGIYQLTPKGHAALEQFAETIIKL